ncbi:MULTISPECIES: PepSY domain-containing protein [Pseudomonadati]|uniref:PepSY domain-containing protein n=1 Tax=Shewanella aestuarii TaxID=1028752 RepID=A0ABT0L2P2_9GAMM|nr:PepSY domain-containing protein [Shewanella aestuarii]MCL1117984.1 PepSY domain-containing protein [Shewanella aestuarii]GGN79323.1 hypothetical protein GCM10009193_23140 [Shewanella aestuarii]
MHKTARKLHQWLMLFLGLQFAIWSVTGAYMVYMDIDFIHGDNLVTNPQTKVQPAQMHYSLQQLTRAYPNIDNISVDTLLGETVYRLTLADGESSTKLVISANSGEVLTPLSESAAISVARYFYTGKGEVTEVALITDNPPFELSPRHLPAWRVNFDDFGAPSLYVSAQTGILVGKRHEFWRWFDWMFRFHIMDYSSGEDIDNALLFWVALLASFGTLTGMVLVYFRVFKVQFTGRKKSRLRRGGVV